MKDFHNLKVWERAHGLTLALYKATQRFPKEELLVLRTKFVALLPLYL